MGRLFVNNGSRISDIFKVFSGIAFVIFFICFAGSLYAQNLRPEGWYRLRTNSLPYYPENIAIDYEGGIWVTANDLYEFDPGVWYRPAEPEEGPFLYLTNSERNNLMHPSFNPPVVYPQLTAPVLYAVRDKSGNKWFSLKNRTVLVQKPDNTWLTFDMPNTDNLNPKIDSTNVDSAHRIRLIDKPDGSQEVLLIANRGIVRIDKNLSVAETRQVWVTYNNYFIYDVLIDSQGRYWITYETSLEKGTSFINIDHANVLFESDPNAPKSHITRIVEDAGGNIWFSSHIYGENGIYCYTADGQWIKYDDGLVQAFKYRAIDIAAGSDGSVWFAAGVGDPGGLLRFTPDNGGEWTHYTRENLGLQSGQILSMAFDETGGLWFTTGITGSETSTGVHYLKLSGAQPSVTSQTYRQNSTSLTGMRFSSITADKSGNVWFPAHSQTSIARLNADGTWQQFFQPDHGSFGTFGFNGAGVDSNNIVYFTPSGVPPVAYDVNAGKWITLPPLPNEGYSYYGLYVDPEDGKWFYGPLGAYYLDAGNSSWTWYDSSNKNIFAHDYRVDDVLMDDAGNVWFSQWYGLTLMKKNPEGGASVWHNFKSNDGSGYSNAHNYRLFLDDEGGIWNSGGQKYIPGENRWEQMTDTSARDQRKLRFANGIVRADMDMTDTLPPAASIDQRRMTVDTRGTIYFTGVRRPSVEPYDGIVAYGPPKGDLDGSGKVDLADAILAAKILVDNYEGFHAAGDISGDFRVGLAEMIFLLQRISGLR